MSGLTALASSNGEATTQVTGTSYLNHSSCISSAPPLPPLAKREKQGFSKLATLLLSPQAREELVWWRDNLEAWNGKALVWVLQTD